MADYNDLLEKLQTIFVAKPDEILAYVNANKGDKEFAPIATALTEYADMCEECNRYGGTPGMSGAALKYPATLRDWEEVPGKGVVIVGAIADYYCPGSPGGPPQEAYLPTKELAEKLSAIKQQVQALAKAKPAPNRPAF